MGADPVACAALAGGADVKVFFVRKEAKEHGLQRRIEGPLLGAEDRCVVVEDVVTTGGSTLAAIEALHEAGRADLRRRQRARPPGRRRRGDRTRGRRAVCRADARSTTSTRIVPTARPAERCPRRTQARSCARRLRRTSPRLLELFGALADYEQLRDELQATE